jgi:phospholipid/cholesterol/gamma-HCH transport system permease protein
MSTTTEKQESQPASEAGKMGVAATIAASFGEPTLEVWRTLRRIAQTGRLTLYYLLNGRIRWRAAFEQAHEIGNRSVVFIAFTLGFLGMILIYQAGYQAMKITGDLQLLGGLFLQLLLREFAPTITALMVATRAGTGMAASIGSMVVTEQVDALKMCAAQPVEYLVVPRFLASTVMMVALTIFAVLVSYLAGAFTANASFNLNFRTFFDLSFIGPFDIIIGLVKSVAYGMAIPIIACEAGLNVFGGSAGVGRATTTAVVNASLAVVILDFLISGIGFVVLALL